MKSVKEGRDGAVPHLRRNMLCAELCFNMRVIELADESICPRLAGVDRDMHVILSMPFPPLL